MPHLQDLWSEVSKKRDDVAILAVNINDPKDRIEKWWSDEGFTLQAMRQEEDEVSQAFKVKAYPTNYVIGPDGKVLYRSVGYYEDQLRQALASTAR
jgi:hypothetical protein